MSSEIHDIVKKIDEDRALRRDEFHELSNGLQVVNSTLTSLPQSIGVAMADQLASAFPSLASSSGNSVSWGNFISIIGGAAAVLAFVLLDAREDQALERQRVAELSVRMLAVQERIHEIDQRGIVIDVEQSERVDGLFRAIRFLHKETGVVVIPPTAKPNP